MKCEEIREKIDQLVFEYDQGVEATVNKHITNCDACADYNKESSEEAKIMTALRNHTPELSNPELLVSDILAGINEAPPSASQKQNTIFIWLPRLLAAACIALLITFSYEQFIVIEKMSTLEKQLGSVQMNENNSTGIKINYITSAYADLSSKNLTPSGLIKLWKDSRKEIRQTNKTESNRYKSGFINKFIAKRSKTAFNTIQN